MRPLVLLSALLITGLVHGQEPTKRTSPPTGAALAKAEKLVADIFKDDIAQAKDAESKTKLAGYLIQQAKENRDDAASRFVLFRQARDLAAQAGDIHLAMAATDDWTRDFDLPIAETRATTFQILAASPLTPEAGKTLLEAVMPVIHEAVENDQYEAAIELAKVAEAAAKKAKSLSLVASVVRRHEEILAVQKGFLQMQATIQKLKSNPNDADANLALGSYYALLKSRWDKALPLLAKGSDEPLKKLAQEDLEKPKDPRAQLSLADGWWDLSGMHKEPAQLSLQRRAAFWYEQALSNLQGLTRSRALKRVEAVAAKVAGTTGDAPVGPIGELKKLEGHNDDVKCVAFSPDGRYAISGGVDQTARIWDLSTGKEVNTLRGHTKQVWNVLFLPNNRQVVTASWDGSARIWDIKTGSEIRRLPHRLDCNGLAVTRDGNFLLTGSDDHNLYLWNLTTGEEVRRFVGHTGFVYTVALSPDGRWAASGGVDKTVRIFELATGNIAKVIDGHTNAVTRVQFSPDSRHVFSCGDGACHLWDIVTGKEEKRFAGHSGLVLGCAVSADGRRLVTGGDDKTLRLWDVTTGKEIAKFTGHNETITAVAISPDGRRALTASHDRTIRLWGLPIR